MEMLENKKIPEVVDGVFHTKKDIDYCNVLTN